MGIDRILPAALDRIHRAVDGQLAEGVVEVIVAADHMGDAHVVVVHHHRQHVGRRAICAQQDVVVDLFVSDRHAALNLILDRRFAVLGHLQADGKGRALLVGSRLAVAPAAVIAHRLLVGALLCAHRLELFGRGVAFVGVPMGEKNVRDFGVPLGPLRLEHRLLVKGEAEPVEPFDDLVDRVLRGALRVGILDPQQRLAAVVAGVEPVEQRGARAAEMQVAGRRWGEACNDRTGFACHPGAVPFHFGS